MHSIKSSSTAKWAGDCDNYDDDDDPAVNLPPNSVCMINDNVESNLANDDDPNVVSK